MAARRYRRLGAPADWPQHRSSKHFVECPDCGRHGMVGGAWADACLRNGHPYQCVCGRKFSSKAAGSAHVRMTRSGDHALLDTDAEP